MNDEDENFESMLLLNQQIASPYISNTHSLLMNIKNKVINEQTKSCYQSPKRRIHIPNNNNHTVKTPLLQKQLNDNESLSVSYSSSSEDDSLEDKMKVVFDKVINRKKNIIQKEIVNSTITTSKNESKQIEERKPKKKKPKVKQKDEIDSKMIKNKEISYQRERRFLLEEIDKLLKENKELKKEIDNELSKRKDYIQIVEEIVNIYNKVKLTTLIIFIVLVNTVKNYLMIKQSLHKEKIYLYLYSKKITVSILFYILFQFFLLALHFPSQYYYSLYYISLNNQSND